MNHWRTLTVAIGLAVAASLMAIPAGATPTAATLEPIRRYEAGESIVYLGGRLSDSTSGAGYCDWGDHGGVLSHTVSLGTLSAAGDYYTAAIEMPTAGAFYDYRFRFVVGGETYQGSLMTFRAVPVPSSWWGLFLVIGICVCASLAVALARGRR